MRWIKEHKLVSILLAIILVTLCVLIGSITAGGKSNPVSNFMRSALNVIEKPFASIGNSVSGIFSYGDLQERVDELEKENEELKAQVTNLTLSANQLQELEQLEDALNYKGMSSSNTIVSGDVVSMDGSNWMNIFTINIGVENGISEGCIVIAGEGLVGRVSATGNGWSKVVSIIDESSHVSFKVSGNLNLIGVIDSSSNGKLSGFMLDSTAKVSEGDTLITSGMGTYPAGITIGKITKVKYDSDAQLERVTVKPSVNFSSLQKVSVII